MSGLRRLKGSISCVRVTCASYGRKTNINALTRGLHLRKNRRSAAFTETVCTGLTPVCPCQMDLQLAVQCDTTALQTESGGEPAAAPAACLSAAAALRQGVAATLDSLAAQALLRHAAEHALPQVGAARCR